MKTVKIKRLKQSSMGTLGILSVNGVEVCQTLELPWVDVELDGISDKNVSCINSGKYICKRRIYHNGGYEVFEVVGVPNRTDVLIHIANFLRNLLGCIGLGMQSGEANGEYCVYRSKEAFKKFMEIMKDEQEFKLEIA